MRAATLSRPVGERSDGQEGLIAARRQTVVDLCEALDIPLSDARRVALEAMTLPDIEALVASLKRHKAWPDSR